MMSRSVWASFVLLGVVGLCGAGELSVGDFQFDGPVGCQGAKVEKVADNHFKITLGHAPNEPGWANHLQFRILRNAKGKDLKITAVFVGETGYSFVSNHSSWSYDGNEWRPVTGYNSRTSRDGNVLTRTAELSFPAMEQDTFWFGWEVPFTYEKQVEMIGRWSQSPFVKVRVLGESLGKRRLYRIEVTDPNSPVPLPRRWVHYFANQHPGECNSMWRMVGMIDWLLSDEGADARKRFLCHFVLMMSPDGIAAGWHRTNAEGVDMNRSYAREGANPGQGHEPYIFQKDLEGIMASDAPATTIWSMHVWPGAADPSLNPGPEIGRAIGPATEFADILKRDDPNHRLVKPLKIGSAVKGRSTPWQPPPPGFRPSTRGSTGGAWGSGPGAQFGVTNLLCEGGGGLYTQKENLDSGVVIIRALTEYYKGVKPSSAGSRPATPASATQVAPNPKPAAHRGNDGLDRLEVGAGPL